MNAMKHAQPRDVWIGVREEDADIVLSLRDNGVGFDTEAPGPEGHFGMAMMRERAQVGGGRFEVESIPGQGTTITVRFPKSLLQDESPPDHPGREERRAQADIRWTYRRENRGRGRRCFPRYPWNQRAGGLRFSPDRPSMTATTRIATPA